MPFTFWGLFLALILILVGYAVWMFIVERGGDVQRHSGSEVAGRSRPPTSSREASGDA